MKRRTTTALLFIVLSWGAWGQATNNSLPMSGGTISPGPLGIGCNPFSGSLVDICGSFNEQSTISNPGSEFIQHTVSIQSNFTAGSGQDILAIKGITALNPSNGITLTNSDNSGVYGIAYSMGLGTVNFLAGVQGVGANQGGGTVVTGADFASHTVINSGGGTLTNHYVLYDVDPGCSSHVSSICGGFYMQNPSKIVIAGAPATYLSLNQDASTVIGSLGRTNATNNLEIKSFANLTLSPAQNTGGSIVSVNGPLQFGGSGTNLTLSTGEVGFAKISASGSAPGGSGGKIELVCGTNSGTAKLIAYAGTSTTPVTILDNIGSGVTGC